MSQRPIMDAGPGLNFFSLNQERLEVLSDDVTYGLSAAVERISGAPFEQRVHSSMDLGETMVIAHAAVAAETVTVLERAAGREHIPSKNAMRSLYGRLKTLDDGLPPLEATTLLSDFYWR